MTARRTHSWQPLLLGLAALLLACEGGVTGYQPGQTDFVSANPNGESYAGPDAGAPSDGRQEDGTNGGGEVRTVEEADIVRVEGNLLYVLNQYRGLQVIDLTTPDQPQLLGMAPIYGHPVEMYVRGTRAYVVVSNYYDYWIADGAAEMDGVSSFRGSQIRVVDIANPASPVVLGGINVEGAITDTRIVGDVLYAVSNRYSWYWYGGTTDTADGTYVLSMNIADPNDIHMVDQVRFDRGGWDNSVHVTPDTIYVASPGYDDSGYRTRIQQVDISDPAGDIALGGELLLSGMVRNRWQMDEHQGVLRVVTAGDWSTGIPQVHTFQMGPGGVFTPLATLDMILPRPESLTAVRFDGTTAYVVTYERVDPLFAIDLSDPANPLQRGELEMPGWLDHIAPRGDRLVALGHDQVNGEWRLAVSLFDVADLDNLVLLDRVDFGEGWGWIPDEADNYDKVFKVLDDLGLVMVPFHSYGYDDVTGYWEHVGGVQLIDFDRVGLTKRGLVDHGGYVKRAIPHGNRVLTVSNEAMQTVDITNRDTPVITGQVELARNVVDFTVMGNYGVQLVGDWYRGDTRLVVVPLSDYDLGTPVAEVRVTAPYGRMFVDGSFIYLVSRDYRTSVAEVRVIDLTDPTNPVVRGTLELPEQVQYWGGYYWGGYGGDELVQVGGDKLVFHVYRYWYRAYQDEVATDDQRDRLYVIDLSDKDAPSLASTVILRNEDWVWGLKAKGDTLFFSHWEHAGLDANGRGLSRYYLDRIDLTDPTQPDRLADINVPGWVVDLSDDQQQVYTLDYEWIPTTDGYGTTRQAFNALRIRGNRAVLQDRLYVDGQINNIMLRGQTAFLTANRWWQDADGSYQDEQKLMAVDLSSPSVLAIADEVELPERWGWLRAVEGNRAFIDIGSMGGLLVYDVADPQNMTLAGFHRHQGWITAIHVHGPTSYVAAGYYGVTTIGLGVM